MENQSNGIGKIINMVKYYLKNSDKKTEVKVGDRITISVPTRTPYGQAKCDIDVLVTQESLKQLINDGLVLVEEENTINLESYKPFVRRLARKNDITFPDALELLDTLKEISMTTHNTLLLELMSEVMNAHKIKNPIIFTINPNGMVVKTMDLGIICPYFVSKEDAKKAAVLMKPFYEEARRRKQEN